KGIRGLVVRVGGWCQGIVKVKGEVSVERWKYAEKKEKGSGGVRVENDVEEVAGETDLGDWQRVIRLGPGALPCSLTFTPAKMKEGNVVKAGDTKWTVIEKHEW
ncbi:MAG: hypothetical protein M1830_006070, partial [Pleopsidium flavum]